MGNFNITGVEIMLRHLKNLEQTKLKDKDGSQRGLYERFVGMIKPVKGGAELEIKINDSKYASIELDEEDIHYFLNKYESVLKVMRVVDDQRIIKESEIAIAEAKKRLENI